SGVPPLGRKRRHLSLCGLGQALMRNQEKMRRWSRLGLLPLLAVAACTQSAIFNSAGNSPANAPAGNGPAAGKTYAASSDKAIGSASPDRWQPPADPVINEELPGTERISLLPGKVGECADTTITSITD